MKAPSSRVYRALLYLLPKRRRLQYGDEMLQTFAESASATAGVPRVLAWIAEINGLLRFAVREFKDRLRSGIEPHVPNSFRNNVPLGRELRMACRGFRARGWRGAAAIVILATALAANSVAFSAADSFLFHRISYPASDRLVEMVHPSGNDTWSASGSPETVPMWREFRDTFSAVYAYGSDNYSMLGNGPDGPRVVWAATVEPGLLELLGARLVAGRFFVKGDHQQTTGPRELGKQKVAPTISIISESLAREQFGSAGQALGKTVALGTHDTTVVGVVESNFFFPTGGERIWTPFDPSLMPVNNATSFLEQLAAGVSIDMARARVVEREALVHARRTPPWNSLTLAPQSVRPFGTAADPKLRTILWLLIGAAVSLLLIACANLVNLEMAAAPVRVRVHAIAVALGASARSLMVTALLEGALVIISATAVSFVLAYQSLQVLIAALPTATSRALTNPLDIDARTLAFMSGIALLAWFLTTVPVALLSMRRDVLSSLSTESRSSLGSRSGNRGRQALTALEVGLSVSLLIGALMSARSYSSLLGIPKGFDVDGVVSVSVFPHPREAESRTVMQQRVADALSHAPFVAYAGAAMGIPPGSGGAVTSTVKIGDQQQTEQTTASGYGVDPGFFKAMGLPIVQGRAFSATDEQNAVVIDEGFAKMYWPRGNAVGSSFEYRNVSFGFKAPYVVVGVAAHLRNSRDPLNGPSLTSFPMYYRLPANSAPLTFVVRLTDRKHLRKLRAMAAAMTPTSMVRAEFVRDTYASAFANELLAASVMNVFGVLALIVSVSGIYSVMAFMVSGRTREIGLRMALGADRTLIVRMILGSSLAMVVVGALVGTVAAFAAARWAAPLLFGVSARDPWIYLGVAAVVIVTAVIATWRPALAAARVDPSTLLRD